jgi:quercetin dioxygenase-like cupin family protein
MKPILILCFLAVALRAADVTEPMPVQLEPRHKTTLENEYVRLIDVQIQPGETTLFHRHVIPSVVVYLTKSTNRSETWGEKTVVSRDISPGESRYAPYDAKPLVHRVTNTGAGLFRVFDIELLHTPPVTVAKAANLPAAAKLQWEEKRARAFRVALDPTHPVVFPADDCARLVIGISGETRPKVNMVPMIDAVTLENGHYIFLSPHAAIQLSSAGAAAEAVVLELR